MQIIPEYIPFRSSYLLAVTDTTRAEMKEYLLSKVPLETFMPTPQCYIVDKQKIEILSKVNPVFKKSRTVQIVTCDVLALMKEQV